MVMSRGVLDRLKNPVRMRVDDSAMAENDSERTEMKLRVKYYKFMSD